MRLLDLCCCEGGASMGYHRAGFEVLGVDVFEKFSQRRYPFGSLRSDFRPVLRWLLKGAPVAIGRDLYGLEDFDAIAISPPCQRFSRGTPVDKRAGHEDLIDEARFLLEETGLPYVIENVEDAPLRPDLMLCGTMFALGAIDTDGAVLELRRHRLFESNVPLRAPGPCRHGEVGDHVAGVYDSARRDRYEARNVRKGGYVPADKSVAAALLGGVSWMSWSGLYQAIPPTYTDHIGRQLIAHLEGA